MVNGKNIDFKSIDRITISSTVLLDEEIVLFRQRYNKHGDVDFILACSNETNAMLRQPLSGVEKKELSVPVKTTRSKKPTKEMLFIAHLIEGIYELQSLDTSLDFIANLKEGKTGYESKFRDWMRSWLKSNFKNAGTEVPKGKGRIDLKITHPKIGNAIVEFKGWWNQDKSLIVQQLYKYLTDFEKTGYLFIVNHTPDDIDAAYRNYITREGTKYIHGSWKKLSFAATDFTYYSSVHKIGSKTKTLFHFIYHVYP